MQAYKRILVALDMGKGANDVLKRAIASAPPAASFEIIHVILPISQAFYANGLGLVQPMVDLNKLEEDIVAKAEVDIEKLVKKAKVPEPAKTRVLMGDIVDTIVAHAKSSKTDLIVLGSHATSGFRLLLGSTANGVLHHAPCDTLMVRI